MMRFIDLGKQIGPNEDWPREFTFFDTITDSFIRIADEQTWESWEDFQLDCLLCGEIIDTERFRRLCPEWVFKEVSSA